MTDRVEITPVENNPREYVKLSFWHPFLRKKENTIFIKIKYSLKVNSKSLNSRFSSNAYYQRYYQTKKKRLSLKKIEQSLKV
ncbi:hypothetical protein PUN28_005878 [Cardiocondyla obscurior]|uniref:Uncharacterized protein n=1 Tax=Cardiocondyla obscurior TaxID=286306 RepID=A0AAW2GB14_9HYME